MSSERIETRQLIKWIFSQLKPYRRKVVLAILALVIGAVSWLMLGQGVKVVVDEGFLADNSNRLNQMMFAVLGIALVGSVAAFFRFYLMIWLGERVSADIRKQVYFHLLDLSPGFFESTRTGEVISRFTADTTVLQTVVGMGLSMALRASITFIGSMLLMLITSPLLTLYVFIAVPLVLLPIKFLGERVRTYAKNSQDRVADMGAYVDESLHEIQTVQAYTHEDIDRSLFGERIEAVMLAASHRIKYRALMIALVMGISITAITIVAWLGAKEVLSAGISAGELTAFMFYAVMAGGAVATISEVIGEIQKAAGASERLLELLKTRPLVEAPAKPAALPEVICGRLDMLDVNFAYPSAKQVPVLKHLNLHIQAGERVALVGPSGAGKSTLFQLLLRFYDLSSGSIQIDGIQSQMLSPETLRKQFALVPQESVIFATNAFENIRYGRPDASMDEVIEAAKAARADQFISELKDGYFTDLGERGVRLSGGQKQRIAIARAILADRPILLLDEATSALDASNEQLVKLALDKLMEGKTTLIIAHRLSTVVNADRIVVMDKGEVVAIGSHQELMQGNSVYRQFAELQLVS
ncbi:ABC transporter transmembrane domain-containing protein [Aliiglaciecola sp. 3_MG-2023]|uniref:ABC transporter transmembrane domain-containing protein n=1 Tax=Aliiglaciecola sp. 3_MG-2023 TaxID=3062644 RepID=UPI0026E395FD|nr:ABC transporter transmembrane domain-containing protein [Aliiglaciecola sp. 3_MG-2023]MDO6695375.1 ABC transporter transmembrane domain-containing protein [Aliiglaciecola sp. 3_MG-2023]